MKLTTLGTSSHLPTRTRSHNAYLLEWCQNEGILFDPGESAQRQFTFAGISHGRVRRIFISHFHGDHCLGLPGMVQRLSMMKADFPLRIYYPKEGQTYIDNLLNSSKFTLKIQIECYPLLPGVVEETDTYRIEAFPLRHSTPVLGYRLTEKGQLHLNKDKLKAAGLSGPTAGKLKEQGFVRFKGEILKIKDFSFRNRDKIFSYVLDTGECGTIPDLIRNADCCLMEGTYLETERELAEKFMHMTGEQAATYAAENGVKQLVLTHYSERYTDLELYQKAVEMVFKNTHIAEDFDIYEF